jgi:hypothetical protein
MKTETKLFIAGAVVIMLFVFIVVLTVAGKAAP